MNRLFSILSLFIIVSISFSYSQVGFSDTFKKTITKIAKEKTKKEITSWMTKQDPVIGIVGRDLIGQTIDSQDRNQLIRSSINVITTMLFLYRVKHSVEQLVDSTEYGIVSQAKDVGWSKKDLIAYSSLYYFYSERLKYKLFVSPHILEMTDVRQKIESLEGENQRKWVNRVSRTLVRDRSKNNDITLDVRALDLLQYSLNKHIEADQIIENENRLMEKLVKTYSNKNGANLQWIDNWNNTKSLNQAMVDFYNEFTEPYNSVYKDVTKIDGISHLPFDLKIIQSLLSPIQNLISTTEYSIHEPEFTEDQIIQSITMLFNNWMEEYKMKQWAINYKFLLGGTYLDRDATMDFTVFDQLRYGYTGEKYSIFLFIGGFFDPLIKNTINKEGSRIYLSGIGFSRNEFNVLVGVGIPYEDIKSNSYQLGITFGYEIPLVDIIK